jgi:hypothetical protein
MDERLDLAYRVLDAQLVDVDGRRCGKADDLELEGEIGGVVHVAALLSGHGAYAARMPRRLRRLGETLFGSDVRGNTVRRVPWREVEEITARIELRRPGFEMGVGEPADLQERFGKVPGG